MPKPKIYTMFVSFSAMDMEQWILKTARDSSEPFVSSNVFIYDFRIPRISAHIFNMREDLWEIETEYENGQWYYRLLMTPQEILEQAKTERLF